MSTLMFYEKIEKSLLACCLFLSGCVLFQPQLTWVHSCVYNFLHDTDTIFPHLLDFSLPTSLVSFSPSKMRSHHELILININREEITSWCFSTHTEQLCLSCSSFSLKPWPCVGCMVRNKSIIFFPILFCPLVFWSWSLHHGAQNV